jgi:hypothetical protein
MTALRIFVVSLSVVALAACGGGGVGGSGPTDGLALASMSGPAPSGPDLGSAVQQPTPQGQTPPAVPEDHRTVLGPYAGASNTQPSPTNRTPLPGGLVGGTWTPVNSNWYPSPEDHRSKMVAEGGGTGPGGQPLQPVPEPETFVLLAMGLGASLLLWKQMRSTNQARNIA